MFVLDLQNKIEITFLRFLIGTLCDLESQAETEIFQLSFKKLRTKWKNLEQAKQYFFESFDAFENFNSQKKCNL